MAIPNPVATGLPNINVVPIVQDSQPGYSLTGNVSGNLLWACTIPGGTVGPNDVIEIQVLWTCNNSAGTKTLGVNLNGVALVSDVKTTSTGSLQSWVITPYQHKIGTQNQFNVYDPGVMTVAPTTVNNSMAQDQYIGMWGQLSVGTDNMQVQYVAIRVWQDRTPVSHLYQGQGKKLMYGVNGHFDYAQTPAQIVTSCQTLGVTVYRCTWEGSGNNSLAVLVALAKAFQGTGISLYVCIDFALLDPAGNIWKDELAAYNGGYQAGWTVASALVPYGVTLFECGNELDTKNNINPTAASGQFVTDFTGTFQGKSLFTALRGALRGCIAGVRAVSPTALAGSNAFTVTGYGCMDGLWYGYAPDGTGGYPTVNWDFTAFHNYRVYGSLLGMVGDFGTNAWVNMLEKMWRNYGKPIFISEFNGNAGDTDAQRASWVTQEMARYIAHKDNYGVQGWIIYSAYDAPYSVLTNPTTLVSTLGTSVASFITANPDPGT